MVHDRSVLRDLVQWVGAEHVLLGSDYPFDMADAHGVEHVRTLGLSAEDEELILGGNAARLISNSTTRR